MLSHQENQLLTRVGPGTPMGEMFRRYWMPGVLSEELPARDGAPVRVQLLGEQLVAFRDTDGNVGLLQEHCPHRAASLGLARNEAGGLRCIYHGWKYDVSGRCVDIPTEPEPLTGDEGGADAEAEATPMGAAPRRFKDRVRAQAYPTREVAGVVWVYMGPPEKVAPFPTFPWLKLPSSQYHAFKVLEECNYAQALEGGLDHTHAAILHRPNPWGVIDPGRVVERELAPRQYVQPTNYGFRYVAVRPAADDAQLIRIINYVAPFWTTVPRDGYGANEHAGDRIVNAWVPRDDTSAWHFQYYFDPGKPVDVAWRVRKGGHQLDAHYRKVRNVDNWYLQDQETMKTRNMSGLEGVLTQDHAVNETQGPVLDRAAEHLGPSDLGVIALRRTLLDAVRAFLGGRDPPGLDPSLPHDRIAAATALAPASAPWDEVLPLDPAFGERSALSAQQSGDADGRWLTAES